MEKDRNIKLTKALYKVTSLFPEKETLSISMRKKGNLILSFLIILNNKELSLGNEELKTLIIKCRRNIEILLSYFEIAEAQNWINSKNFEILKSQYKEILSQIEDIKIVEKQVVHKKLNKKKVVKEVEKETKFTLSEIQEKVVQILQGSGKMKPSDLNHFFPDINPRSLRREIKDLKSRGIVASSGGGRNTSYEMNSYF